MSAQNSSGIQTLLDAERKAHEIVQSARAYRTQRLKAAKVDAAAEIAAYKQEKEAEFKAYEAEHTGTSSKAEEEANASVQSELDDIAKKASAKKAEVVARLLEAVNTPNPTLHINAH
ncbi:hypothetical protein DV451_001694 [Geotrichum candidum]|uniref:V-type proton ATPase subunit G n=1 Tax=Geotrichum candidum TaxID=1173061 RepID=A0A0J9XET2_GEOCN|nr:hypothetical protein DV451_001694 [Geotrichum candidum]KAF5108068.1 hypothetical protein DV452_004863 [Geotrichum candidum]KAF5110133.1 hypothetical protein DV453_001115 [Geotrichum candidum]KAF5124878.1 hypothetical protein DV495_003703 [Geotrichum candidum]KAF7501666.1 hypothetical protein DV113_000201 [Geotrichum candidum]